MTVCGPHHPGKLILNLIKTWLLWYNLDCNSPFQRICLIQIQSQQHDTTGFSVVVTCPLAPFSSEAPETCKLTQHFSWHHQELILLHRAGIDPANTASPLTQRIPRTPQAPIINECLHSWPRLMFGLHCCWYRSCPIALLFQVHPFDKVKTATKTQTKTSPELRHAQPNLTF